MTFETYMKYRLIFSGVGIIVSAALILIGYFKGWWKE